MSDLLEDLEKATLESEIDLEGFLEKQKINLKKATRQEIQDFIFDLLVDVKLKLDDLSKLRDAVQDFHATVERLEIE